MGNKTLVQASMGTGAIYSVKNMLKLYLKWQDNKRRRIADTAKKINKGIRLKRK